MTGACPFWGRGFEVAPDAGSSPRDRASSSSTPCGFPLPERPRIRRGHRVRVPRGDAGPRASPRASVVATEISPPPSPSPVRTPPGSAGGSASSSATWRPPWQAASTCWSRTSRTCRRPRSPPPPPSLAWEPHVALVGGADGAELLRRLVRDLPRLLFPGGHAWRLDTARDRPSYSRRCSRPRPARARAARRLGPRPDALPAQGTSLSRLPASA